MWQLELLSRIIPAFGALAKEFIACDHHDAWLRQDAQDCYSDIVLIGCAVSVSRGEWASGMNNKDITELLTALESRFPTRWKPFLVATRKLYEVYFFIPPTAYHNSGAHCSLDDRCRT
jgi:hypothetical protein